MTIDFTYDPNHFEKLSNLIEEQVFCLHPDVYVDVACAFDDDRRLIDFQTINVDEKVVDDTFDNDPWAAIEAFMTRTGAHHWILVTRGRAEKFEPSSTEANFVAEATGWSSAHGYTFHGLLCRSDTNTGLMLGFPLGEVPAELQPGLALQQALAAGPFAAMGLNGGMDAVIQALGERIVARLRREGQPELADRLEAINEKHKNGEELTPADFAAMLQLVAHERTKIERAEAQAKAKRVNPFELPPFQLPDNGKNLLN